MKILSLIVCVAAATSCSNKHKSTEYFEINTAEKYDLTKDTSVYSGEMKRYWLVHIKKRTKPEPG